MKEAIPQAVRDAALLVVGALSGLLWWFIATQVQCDESCSSDDDATWRQTQDAWQWDALGWLAIGGIAIVVGWFALRRAHVLSDGLARATTILALGMVAAPWAFWLVAWLAR